jgi:hypothetical protein
MANTRFPTDYTPIASISPSVKLYADDGSANGTVLISDIIGLIPGGTDTGAPAGSGTSFRNGFVYLRYYPGLVAGRGVTSGQRSSNTAAINAAIQAAYNAGKTLIGTGDEYEVAGTIIIPVNAGFKSDFNNTTFWQYTNNVPIMTIGSQAGSNYSYGTVVRNIQVRYAVDVSGQTNTAFFRIGDQDGSVFENFSCGQTFGNIVPWRGVEVTNLSGGGTIFSCVFSNFQITGSQNCLLNVNLTGTQNYWSNFYINNGGGTSNPVNGIPVMFDGGGAEQMSGEFHQLNIEWAACNSAMKLKNFKGFHFYGLHFEGILMFGPNPCLINSEVSESYYHTLELKTIKTNGSGGLAATGTPRIFTGYSDEIWKVTNLKIEQDTPGEITLPSQVMGNAGFNQPIIEVECLTIQDAGGNNLANWSWDSNIPYAALPFGRTKKYTNSYYGSVVTEPKVVLNTDITNYGWARDAIYQYPATMGAVRNITLSRYLTANGVPIATTSGTSGQPVITVPSSVGVSVGIYITGTGIPNGTTVASFTSTTITLSANLTTGIGTSGCVARCPRPGGQTVTVFRDCNGAGDGFALNVKDDYGNIIYTIPAACAARVFYFPPFLGATWTPSGGLT